MPANYVYFDLETKRTANDVGGWDRKGDMGISVGVTYSSATGEYTIFSERQVDDLIQTLLRADWVVGYNVINFDYEVLMGHTILHLPSTLRTIDLMVDVEQKIGHRLGLDALATATLGVGKTADGLDAIRWWREGKLFEIAEYCCYDVKVTRLIHEYGAHHKKLYYDDRFGQRQQLAIDWSLE